MSDLDALLALITQSVYTVKAQYAAYGHSIPSLDSIAPHPVDKVVPSPELKLAVQTIQGACAQLCATVLEPMTSLHLLAFQMFEPACIRLVIEANVADHLAEYPNGLHILELSKKTNVDAGKLGRILRLLAARHVFRETEKDTFANNRLGILLTSSSPTAPLLGHLTDDVFSGVSALTPTLLNPSYASSTGMEVSAFSRARGTDMPYWEYIEKVDKKMGERFGRAMMGLGEAMVPPVLARFPWKDLPPGTTVCDVGSGVGAVSLALAGAFPALHIILQDTPSTIEQAKQLWAKEAPDAVSEGRIEFVALDFLKESPRAGCDFYFLKLILHDWPDAQCLAILANVKKAMQAKPTSRLLIDEFILPSGVKSSLEKQAPEPLLPNYGAGRVYDFYVDMNMMCTLNSRERYLDEFHKMGVDSGFELVKVWDLGISGLMEFKLSEAT